ncbi:4CL3-like protein [Mya arenaria]|uniref:4CL3-like protein n=1 Tax=Mya arenaria TaxID=6604 RepID=A0ABY7FH11_MYAAR|nr:4CL3-like protein [Mya arenaria]
MRAVVRRLAARPRLQVADGFTNKRLLPPALLGGLPVLSEWSSQASIGRRHFSQSSDIVFKSPYQDLELPVQTISDYLFSRFGLFGDKLALVDNATGSSYLYSQLEELSRRVGSFLSRRGYRKGDVVCYYGTNNPEFALLLLGCSTIGVTLTTANPAYTPKELQQQMGIAGARGLIFTVPALVPKCKEAGFNDLVVIGSADGCLPFTEVLADDGRAFPTDVHINPMEDVAVLPFSSGTTGLPKGVMMSLTSYPEDNNLGVLPFYHIYGMAPILLGSLQDGSTLYTLPAFDPEAYLTAIVKHKITQIHIVPPIILFMARHPICDKFDFSRLRTVLCAAAPLGEALTLEFEEKRKGLKMKQGFGLTETSPVVAVDVEPITLGSVGPLIANVRAKIIDPETSTSLGRNEVGELCVKGPQNMKGYHGNEKATREMIDKDGWLHTGDMGYFTDNDRLVISDRLKELIKYKGMQVAPAELEDVIHKHPAVQDVAVIGVPDERAGELPQAFVVCKPNVNATEDDIKQPSIRVQTTPGRCCVPQGNPQVPERQNPPAFPERP